MRPLRGFEFETPLINISASFATSSYYLIRIINDEGTTFLDSPPVTHLAFTGAKALGLVDLFNVGPSFDAEN